MQSLRFALSVAAAGLVVFVASACAAVAPQPAYVSHEFAPAPAAPDFTLTAADGSRTSLSGLRGTVTVVYFGYTHCPDVCPTTAGAFASAFAELSADVRSQVRFLMVTVDPKRDTPEVMGRYVAHFAPDFVGLSGTQAEIDDVISTWNLPVECGEVAPDGSYSVGHPASAWVIDREGRQRLHVAFGTAPSDIASDLQRLVTKG